MDEFSRSWIIENGISIVGEYGGNLTIRALYYRLVAKGMTNSDRHYKRVVGAMIKARWDGLLNFYDFKDHDRETLGETPYEETFVESVIDEGKGSIDFWMNYYKKNKWENQPYYIEVFIEKKALQGVFDEPCRSNKVALSPCKGYPSLTFMYDASERIREASNSNKECIILYFGDYDPSGEDIPRSIQSNLSRLDVSVEVERILLLEDQVIEWDLPPAPTKSTDSRSKNWSGIGQVELDAIEPRKLKEFVDDSISKYFDDRLYDELMDMEETEKIQYQKELKDYVKTL